MSEEDHMPIFTPEDAIDDEPLALCKKCGLDWLSRNATKNQLDNALHFWNAIVIAIEPPGTLGPDDLLPWIIGKIRLAKMSGAI